MSSSLEELFNEVNIQNPLVNGPAEPSAEFTKPQEEYRYQGDIAPTIQDAERIAQSKYNVSSHNALMGTLVSAGVEIGTGIGGTIYATKAMKGMKWANRAKNVALAGVVAPEPVSTVTGAIAFGATEAAIWGFSNFLGQTARKSFGIQDHYSGGEMIAAAVFGTAAATAQGTKLIQLAPSLASMKAWKSMPIARETGKAFVTGAGLGVAESLLRQEVQLILNERENRDVMDYMFSGAAGGTFNTVFSVFGRTGAWGLTKAGDAAANARHLAEQKLAQARKMTSKRKRRKEIKKWTEALEHLKEVETSFRGAAQAERDYHKNAPEPEQVNNPSGDPRQAPKLDPLENPNAPEGNLPSEIDYSDAKLGDTIEIVSVEGKRSQVEVIGISEQSGAIRFKRKDGSEGVTGLAKDSVLNDINSPNYILQAAGHGTQNKNIKDLSDVELDELEASLKAAFKESPSLKNADGEASNRDHQSDLFAIQVEKARRSGKNPEAPETPKDIPEGEAPETPKDIPEGEAPETPDVAPEGPSYDTFSYKELQAEAKKQGIKANQKKQSLLDELNAKKPDPETPTETPTQPQSPTEEAAPQLTTQRQQLIESYKERFRNIKGEPSLARQFAPLQADSNALKTEMDGDFQWRIEDLTAKYQAGDELSEVELDEMLELVSDLRSLNEVDNVLKTTAGRGTQANRSDAEKYVSSTDLSLRAIREDAALFDMEETLQQLRRGEQAPNMEQQMELFFKSNEQANKINAAVYGGQKLSKKELDELGITAEELNIQRKSATLIQRGIKALSRQLEKERAKMSAGMKTAMNNTQKKKLADEVKKRLKENPSIRMLETKLKYYKEAELEIKQIAKAEQELARLTNLEADGSLGQVRSEVEVKPKFKKETNVKLAKLRKQISESKGRMRSKVKAIDNAKAEMDKFDLFLSMQSYTMRNIEADASNKFVQFGRDVRAARRLALIDQIPSILAGVPTGVGLAMRSAIRPFAMAPLDFARYGGDTAKKLFAAELQGLATTILNWNGTATSMGRTFQRGSSATDQVMSKYLEESTHKAIRMGNRPSVERAMKTAEARLKQQKDPMNTILDFRNNGGWALLSLGVRGIGAIDDGFRRQILRGRLETAARRKAIMENPNDPKLAEEAYNNYMKTMWRDQNGLQVLNNYKEFINDVNDINQNLLFAAQHDNPDLFHQNMGEQLISKLSEAAKGDTGLAYLVDAFMPYISVPIRGVYRGVRFAAAPVVGAKAASPLNPYTQKINERVHKIETSQFGMMKLKEGDAEFKQLADDIKNAQTEIQILKEREIKYKEDAMVDTAFGVGLATLGMSAAALGEATGSLNWMSKDQKEKNKLKPFQMFGMDYSAAAPWSIPIAIGADIFQYVKAREAGVLDEKQNVAFMLSATVADMAEQVPMMQGFQTFNSIISGGMETKTKLVGRMAAGYIPLPAQVRKTVMATTEDGTVGDLRGGTFGQRTAYAFFGIKPVNRKTDYFGEDVQSGKTWLQHAVIRQAPSKDQGLNTEFERVLASDAFDNIQAVPSSLGHRMKMTSFVDEEGVTLQYAYARRLREHRKFYKGKKRTLKQAVNHLIRSSKWRKKHRESTISKSLQHNNEGLRELNKLMQDYYFDVRQSIIKDDNFTKRFVNHRDENLYDLVRRKETKILGNTRPIRELLQAN